MQQRLLAIAVCFSLIAVCLPALANAQSKLIEKAYQAYEKKNQAQLTRYTNQLKASGSDLAPYAQYWQIKRNSKNIAAQTILALIEQTPDYAFNQDLKAEYLVKLGADQQWSRLLDYYPNYQENAVRVQCRYWEAQAKVNGNINKQAVYALWFYPKRRPGACNGLFDWMMAHQVITNADILTRIRMAALNGHTSIAKNLAVKLPRVNNQTARLFDRARKSPKRFLTRKVASSQKPLGAIINLYALDRMARKNPKSAVNTLQRIAGDFSQENRKIAWEIVAYRSAKNLDAGALRAYQKAYQYLDLPPYLQETDFYLERNAWHARAALRAENWAELLNVVKQMPPIQQKKARWRYWSARAMHQVYAGQVQYQNLADNMLTTLGQERHYYGWLAAEEMGMVKEGYYQPAKLVDQALLKQVASQVNIQRAVALHQADVQKPARRAWYYAIKNYSDQEYLAAAAYAKQLGWHDIAINSADRTKLNHDFNLRYPKPYANDFHRAAASEGLDESWVLGLVRQESRFIDYAKSRVGAAGLMQLMPKTARWAAKKKGLRGYKKHQLYQAATNIALGTYYMRYTLDLLGGNAVLATAGYNAGPSRALKWMADRPLEAAIYIETIPFNETRNYVQRVMANAHFYETRVGVPKQTIKQRIGIIPAKHK